ncbi:hypothetical protein ACWOBX_08245 [Facklamia languida]
MLITTDLSKDEVWKEVVRRTRHNNGDFKDSEVRIIKYYSKDNTGKSAGRNKVPVKAIEADGTVRHFESVIACCRFYGVSDNMVYYVIKKGAPTRGPLKGVRIEYAE